MEKHILPIAHFENKEKNDEKGYGKIKMINDCPYYQEETGKSLGDCNINHFKPCTLEPNRLYFDCNIYNLSFL